MAEHVERKITRAQAAARHAYRRALAKSLRAAAKGTGWRCADGCLFREHGMWFVSVQPAVNIYAETTEANVSVKPMSIDPIFWDLTDMLDNKLQPLSFRMNGAFVCRPPEFARLKILEDPDPKIVASRLIDAADTKLVEIAVWTADAFLAHCRAGLEKSDAYLPSTVASLIDQGRASEALALCERAQQRGQHGGFILGPDGGFSKVAAAWLRRAEQMR